MNGSEQGGKVPNQLPGGSLEFCQEFGYPPEVKAHFQEILGVLDPAKVHAVLLHGSTARGELSYVRAQDGRLELRSDYEFVIVAPGKVDRRDYARLRVLYKAMQREIGAQSPLFHIDFACRSLNWLRRQPRRFLTFEMRHAGRVIYGPDIREEIPEVTASNLDYRELRSVLLWRLWPMLLFAPPSWISGRKPSPRATDLYRHVIARNVLDLTTLLLPLEGQLIPSFTRRVQYITEHYQSLGDKWQFAGNLPGLLNEALASKMTGQFSSSLDDLYQRAVNAFVDAGRYVLRRECPTTCEMDLPMHFTTHARDLFQDGTLRFRLLDLYLLASTGRLRLERVPQWLRVPKMGTILAFLYQMHQSLLLHKQDCDSEATTALKDAAGLWERLELRRMEPLLPYTASFPRRWEELRRRFMATFQWYHPGVRQQQDYQEHVLEYMETLG